MPQGEHGKGICHWTYIKCVNVRDFTDRIGLLLKDSILLSGNSLIGLVRLVSETNYVE
jgi:hypothetical protein